MIAKLSKGGSFSGAVQYIFGPGKGADCLAGMAFCSRTRPPSSAGSNGSCAKSQGLETRGTRRTLLFASGCCPVGQPIATLHCGGVSGPDGVKVHSLSLSAHRDREHPHLHILFNRVSNDGRTISDRNDRYRSERLCKQLTARYGLYLASGKEQVKEYRLREPGQNEI